ncbi:MAG TPA: cytochrome C [Xanthobacteraceae bacterium]|jgi:cytochrome c553
MTKKCLCLAFALVWPPASAGAASLPPAGAAACAGCHPQSSAETSDKGALRPLTGRNAAELETAMKAFRTGARPATVMDRIAKGFSDDEIAAIAAYYAAQK